MRNGAAYGIRQTATPRRRRHRVRVKGEIGDAGAATYHRSNENVITASAHAQATAIIMLSGEAAHIYARLAAQAAGLSPRALGEYRKYRLPIMHHQRMRNRVRRCRRAPTARRRDGIRAYFSLRRYQHVISRCSEMPKFNGHGVKQSRARSGRVPRHRQSSSYPLSGGHYGRRAVWCRKRNAAVRRKKCYDTMGVAQADVTLRERNRCRGVNEIVCQRPDARESAQDYYYLA